eukprot:SAG11_NODE_2005_length_3930_cov_28.915166_2_plen_51_part_00
MQVYGLCVGQLREAMVARGQTSRVVVQCLVMHIKANPEYCSDHGLDVAGV